MALTKRQLAIRVLRQGLPVADALTDPSSEDTSFVEGVYDTKLAVWRDLGLVYWPNTDATTSEIPDVVVDALVALLANACGRPFGVDVGSPVQQMATEEALLMPLRRHIAKQSAGESVEIEYF
jgi:hypothetical protein